MGSLSLGAHAARDEIVEALVPHVDLEAPGCAALVYVLASRPMYLAPDQRFAYLNSRMLLAALVEIGRTHGKQDWRLNPPQLLTEWIASTGVAGEISILTDDRTSELGLLRVKLSDHVELMLRAAAAIAASTGAAAADLRHIMIAMTLKYDPVFRDLRNPVILRPDVSALRAFLLKAVVARPLPGENVAGWNFVRALPVESSHTEPEAWRKVAYRPQDSLPTVADEPASSDALGRATFARVIAGRLRDAYSDAEQFGRGAFMAHIHGPWGAGKSSVLNLLREELERPGNAWLVVGFNAWKHHRVRPPWWSLISAVYSSAVRRAAGRRKWHLRWIWWSWRLRADWAPVIGAAVVLWAFLSFGPLKILPAGNEAVKVLAPLLAAAAGIYAYTRLVFFGSAKAADAYADLKTDPYRPIVSLYCRLIGAAKEPVAVFIDDLDRCESGYVVELLEGIQTLLRSEPAAYVVAADRKWICSAFEKKYADFSATIGEPARPLGYLFLEKIFQISAGLPSLPQDVRASYWRQLISPYEDAESVDPLTLEDAEAKVRGERSVEGLQQIIAAAPAAHKTALRAAAAIAITRGAAAKGIEHRLLRFSSFIEANPRAMKRLVNAVGMAQAQAFLEGRDPPLDTLARWTILELRWPLLAECLREDVGLVDRIGSGEALASSGVPPNVLVAAQDRSLRALIATHGEDRLDADALRVLFSDAPAED
jgi:hypothetical protein